MIRCGNPKQGGAKHLLYSLILKKKMFESPWKEHSISKNPLNFWLWFLSIHKSFCNLLISYSPTVNLPEVNNELSSSVDLHRVTMLPTSGWRKSRIVCTTSTNSRIVSLLLWESRRPCTCALKKWSKTGLTP